MFHGLPDGTAGEWRDAFLYEYFWERAFPQTPTVLGDRYKLIRFHGVWEPYKLYDLESDPHEIARPGKQSQPSTTAGWKWKNLVAGSRRSVSRTTGV